MLNEELSKKLLTFKEEISDLSIEELQKRKDQLDNELSKMILDSDLFIKMAIINTLIEEKSK